MEDTELDTPSTTPDTPSADTPATSTAAVIAKTYKVKDGITVNGKTELTEAEYAALTVEEKKAAGFVHDPEVVYQCAEDKIDRFGEGNGKQYTLDAQATNDDGDIEKIPVGTKYHGLEEAHFNFDGIKAEIV